MWALSDTAIRSTHLSMDWRRSNSKDRLRQQMDATSELKIPSILFFGDGPAGSTTDSSGAVVEGTPHAM